VLRDWSKVFDVWVDYSSTLPHQLTGASGLEVRRPAQGVKQQATRKKL